MIINFPKNEKKILRFWKKNNFFERSAEKRSGNKNFVFFEGPPTANAKPGLHHVLARVFKDIICRYKTMRGFKVLRKAGWDTHGLPVELQIEKKLGLKSKKDIEKYGIADFNKKCKESVWRHKKDWEKITERIAFWIDTKNPYITYLPEYIETVWWILKQIWQKGLLYQDYKVVPYCARCGTALSSHEVALGYKKTKEPSIYVKFPILNPEFKNTFFLVWTTTPWTLPGNVAIALNESFIYSKIKIGEEYLILSKERRDYCGIKGEIVKEFKGKELLGLRYQPFYPSGNEEILKKAYKIIPADFVSLDEGTGLVHIAPAFGEEDMKAGKKNDLPILLTVDEEGKFTLDVKKWAGIFVKEADPLIIQDLKNKNLLFEEKLYEHDYPFCWRCSSPLLYYAKKSWFIKMTKLKKDLIENNQKINWIPPYLKEGRFGEWLREIKDWALTRERYWGTPLPIWKCKNCGFLDLIGSLKDLLDKSFSSNNYYLFRHGHSFRQLKKVSSCWPEKYNCPLTEKGKNEVLENAKKIKKKKIDFIFSSDLLRTKQTAEIIFKETGAKIIFDKRLREFNVGIFNGKSSRFPWEYLLKKKKWLSAKIPKGESLVFLKKRMYSFLKEINEKYKDKNILIVSHELPLTILEFSLKGCPLERVLKMRYEKKIKTIETGDFRKIEFKKIPFNQEMELDFHRPYVDEIKFFCPKCEGSMERSPEVIDCWFDSGSMPFAQYHYPFENKKIIENKKQFPADYISEAVDQTRGWFYTLLAISTLLGKGPAYKNVISLGHILDEKGEKMSKSKGNVVDPWQIIEKYGADAVRWYFYTINQPGDSKLFSEKDIEQSLKKFILTFWNVFAFYKTYTNSKKPFRSRYLANILDRWIISNLNELVQETTSKFEEYDVVGAARKIENFVINDLSLWYVRRSRPRFQKPKTKNELKEVSEILNFILLTVSKLAAPFLPFLSEEIFKNLRFRSDRSVHLEKWPKANEKFIDKKLKSEMKEVMEIVSTALSERAKAGIKIRQPLQKLEIPKKVDEELKELIKDGVNVKEIILGKTLRLDTEITPRLKEEGTIREIIRHVQEMRKIAGFKPKDGISVNYFGTIELNEILNKNRKFILKEGKIKNLELKEKDKNKEFFAAEKELSVDRQKLWLAIKKNKI